MGPTRGRQDPGGPHVGPMNLAIRDGTLIMDTRQCLLGIITVTWRNMASNHQKIICSTACLLTNKGKKYIFFFILALCWGNATVTGGFPSPMISNLESIFNDIMTWKHFLHYWSFVSRIRQWWWIPLTKDQYCRAIMSTLLLICTSSWTYGQVAVIWDDD